MEIMNEQEIEDFYDSLDNYPAWIHTFEDMQKYARHLNFRLQQANSILRNTQQFIKDNHPEIYELICSDREIYHKANDMDFLYQRKRKVSKVEPLWPNRV